MCGNGYDKSVTRYYICLSTYCDVISAHPARRTHNLNIWRLEAIRRVRTLYIIGINICDIGRMGVVRLDWRRVDRGGIR
jgi:hypothetical protein